MATLGRLPAAKCAWRVADHDPQLGHEVDIGGRVGGDVGEGDSWAVEFGRISFVLTGHAGHDLCKLEACDGLMGSKDV
jgi:hypothetical protein